MEFCIAGGPVWGIVSKARTTVVCVVCVCVCVHRCEFLPAGIVGQFPSPAESVGVQQCRDDVLRGPCSSLGGLHCKSHNLAVLVC